MAIGQAAIIQDLQQRVEEIWVSFFNFVEQDDLIRPAPNRFCQDAAFIIAHIAGRRADQTGDRMLLLELRHVEPQHGAIIIEQELGQGFGQLSFTDPRGTDK